MITVLGLDPGFASTGWALVELHPSGEIHIKSLGLIETEKANKKQKVLASDDNFKRARELSRAIRYLIYGMDNLILCSESMSFPRNSSTAAKMAMCWGVIADICEEDGLPMLMATPKEIKKAVGSEDSSKDAVQAALHRRFGDRFVQALVASRLPKSKHEHPVDALASVVACLDSETLRLMWKVAAP
jgi:Holliday junction resolvasome RuvABC endonuclease subunit